MTSAIRPLVILVALALAASATAQQRQAAPKAKAKARAKAAQAMVAPGKPIRATASLASPERQEDFPVACLAKDGSLVVAYIEYDGTADTVRLARRTDDRFIKSPAVSSPGNVWQPAVACDGRGTVWCIWSQLNADGWSLRARSFRDGKLGQETITLDDSPGNHVFVDAGTDASGRVWVAWQRINGGMPDIFAQYFDPTEGADGAWSESIQVTNHPAGDWEPRLAFAGDQALVVFDSYRNGDFDVFLARVSTDGQVKLSPIAASPRYEARAEAVASADGKTLWVAYEDGIERWGKDLGSEWRKSGGGLQYDRHVHLVKHDLTTGRTTMVGDVTRLISNLMAVLGMPDSPSICLPEVVVDGSGDPWVFFRFGKANWKAVATKYDVATGAWTQPQPLSGGAYTQDRRTVALVGADGALHIVWPGDGRQNKQQGTSNVYAATIDPAASRPTVDPAIASAEQKRVRPTPEPVNITPERPRDERHTWTIDGQEYTLYWGDVHRHTSFSACRTPDDGCITEHFRYAYDAAGLDYLATSDHTDANKVYHEYEWWQNQKLADLFHSPGYFVGVYGYEREQRWPYGHRNVLFTERGGPIIYIKRQNYANSPWATPLPPQDGQRDGEFAPWQLWDLLRASGMRAVTIEHTAAGSMGTDWSVYDQIDQQIENVVEIYQGSRNSYEAPGAPQPAVAKQGGPMDFGQFSAGAYQNALRLGHKLGVFASSDHRSTNISFGGVYVKKFDREGIFDAIDARHTIAATDKIFMEFSCNGHLLGEIFETSDKPAMTVRVRGTAPLAAVSIIRNEVVIRRFALSDSADFDAVFTDEVPVVGENRYYVRVEQTDGNMGWTSPVWATYRP